MTPIALDIFVGSIIVISGLVAYLRGIIKEVFTLVTFFLSIFLSYIAGHLLVPEFNSWFGVTEDGGFEKGKLILGILSPPMAAKFFSYGSIFLLVFIVLALLGGLLSRWIKETGLSIVDRVLGGAFGVFRGFLLLFLIYIPFNYVIEDNKFPEWATESISFPMFKSTFAWANNVFGLDKKIESSGSGIMIKFHKIDPEKMMKRRAKLKKDVKKAKKELKESIDREEKKVQKEVPKDILKEEPDILLDDSEKNIDPNQQPNILLDKIKKNDNPETYPHSKPDYNLKP